MAATISKTTCLYGLIFLFLTGCAPQQGNVKTKKDPSYQGKLGKVLIVPFNEDSASRLGRDFSNRLLARLAGSLAHKDVASEIVHVNKEDLDQGASVNAAAVRFHPGQVLYVGVSSVITKNEVNRATPNDLLQFTSKVSITILLRIWDMHSAKTVWRGEIQFYIIPNPEDVADQFIKQLETEQLF